MRGKLIHRPSSAARGLLLCAHPWFSHCEAPGALEPNASRLAPWAVRLDATDQTDAVSVLWLGVAGDVTGLGDGLFWSKVFSLVDG